MSRSLSEIVRMLDPTSREFRAYWAESHAHAIATHQNGAMQGLKEVAEADTWSRALAVRDLLEEYVDAFLGIGKNAPLLMKQRPDISEGINDFVQRNTPIVEWAATG